LNDPEELAYYNEIMGERNYKNVLKYRGSRDGWKNEDFHRKIDNKAPTVTFFKIKDNG
jgi:hypothetical protein